MKIARAPHMHPHLSLSDLPRFMRKAIQKHVDKHC